MRWASWKEWLGAFTLIALLSATYARAQDCDRTFVTIGCDATMIEGQACLGDVGEPGRPNFRRMEYYTGLRRVFSRSLYSSGDRAR
jgi:hypothetical protein